MSTEAQAQWAQCPAPGSCFSAHGSPGCDEGSCCNLVCDSDAFCCNNQWDNLCATAANTLCANLNCAPACGKTNVECLNPGPEYDNSRFVARFQTGGFCTAWIIAGPNVMLTNNHCSANVGDVVEFNFECSACTGGTTKPTVSFVVDNVLFCDAALDICVFTVAGDVASQFGQAIIDPSVPAVGEQVYEAHHAAGDVKGFDIGNITALFQSVGCPGDITEHAVSVIASQGASGSPVFRQINHAVVAVCNCGPACSAGFVLPMSTLWPTIKPFLDEIDASYAVAGQEACLNANHGCYVTGSAGCTDATCCNTVCTLDPFCCNNSWDVFCVESAAANCPGCGNPNGGSCYAEHGPYCADESCCNNVCAFDPFCCDSSWDNLCVDEAFTECAGCGDPSSGSCYAPHANTGCEDENCCLSVCNDDTFCCDTEWDQLCADEAAKLCPGCGNPGAGDCFVADFTPYCNDAACCDYICSIDPFCCTNSWDNQCANEAVTFCTPQCGGVLEQSCFTPGTAYCNDAACCEFVCNIDPFCCTNSWDGLCVNRAIIECVPQCGGPYEQSCYSTGSPFCDDEACCNYVCSNDPFCCSNQWDGLCVNQALAECAPQCGAALMGPCNVAHNTPFCNDESCCNAVCAVDAFCCNNQWDSLCVSEAQTLCSACGPCPADFDGNGTVNAPDLAFLLGAWGTAADCPDLDNSGQVNAPDLAILLGSWGPCAP
ncbi:MAG: trypsin-like peptidase domain-containing protein [Phycisphaerae bacterium]|nr:trypsin-like peptidase domain-containing protein [Phycisphaerae bacterium]